MMFPYIMKLDNKLLYKELGEAASFILITKENLTQTKHFGLKLIETGEYTKDKFENKDIKKVNISKASYIVLAIYILILALLILV